MSLVMLNHAYFSKTIKNAVKMGLIQTSYTDAFGNITDILIHESNLDIVKQTDSNEEKRLELLSPCSCCGLITMHFVMTGDKKECVDCYIASLDKVN